MANLDALRSRLLQLKSKVADIQNEICQIESLLPPPTSDPLEEPEPMPTPEQSSIQKFFVYTDGSCLNNQGRGSNVGGMGVYIELNGHKFAELNAGSLDTTNNRMELLACIEGLKYLKQHVSASQSQYEIVLLTDSQYVKNGIVSWIQNWKRNNWKTSNKTDVKNRDLWQQLDQFNQQLTVQWKWVRGHAQCFGNKEADRLAVEAAHRVRKDRVTYEAAGIVVCPAEVPKKLEPDHLAATVPVLPVKKKSLYPPLKRLRLPTH
ncbi:hypothetical protein P9112_012704 [Eukaryota sp. TZLM1-RC]